jgi:carbon starvation protein
VVAGWGWFLIQGVQDPLGGINTLWPLFGISNQLLAAIALAVGTTVLVRSGKARFAWVTLLPLAWLLLVTLTAGWQKIFAADPRLGFLSHAAATAAGVAAGTVDPSRGARLIFNDRLNVAMAALFMSVVVLVVISSARVWLGILRGRAPATTQEAPYVETSYAS